MTNIPLIQDWLRSNLTFYVPGALRKRIPVPGVYAIYIPETNEVYFGQTKHLYRRRIKHIANLKNNAGENRGLQNAFNKSGRRMFEYYYLNLPEQTAKEYEQKYITMHYGQPYLLNHGRWAATPTKGIKYTEDRKAQMSKITKTIMEERPEVRELVRKAAIRQWSTPGTREIAIARCLPNLALGTEATSKPVLINDATYPSISEAGRRLGMHRDRVARRVKSRKYPGWVRLQKGGIHTDMTNTEQITVPSSKGLETALEAPMGFVMFCDGGTRPNPGPGGWGIHGYLYRAAKPKKGSGNPDHILTAAGYITKVQYAEQKEHDWTLADYQEYVDNSLARRKHLEITPVQYIDGYGSFHHAITNNIAEMVAATQALEYAARYDVQIVQLLLDSQYVCKGLVEYVPTWIRNNWIKSDGMVVKNAEYWKKLVSARDALTNRGVKVRLDWIKGHNDHLGNEMADEAATIGVMVSQRAMFGKSWGYSPEAPAINTIAEISMTDAEGYWKYDSEKHPFLSNPRMYFNTCTEYLRPGEYYLGNGKEDEQPGKRISDGAYAVVKLAEPDVILEMVRTHQSHLAENIMALASARLDVIYRPDIHKKLATHGPLVMVQDDKSRLDLFDLHSLDNGNQKEPLTREHRPPHLALRAVEAIEELMLRLNQYIVKDPELVVTDLTAILYEKSQKVVKKETIEITTLNPKYNVGFAKLEIDANYQIDAGVGSAPVILTLGIDLLDRNALKRLESSDPKVSLISWLEAPHIFRYATVVEAGGDVGIWAGVYSNLRIVTPQSH